MGTITGQNILDDARQKASDTGGSPRWSSAVALRGLNAGQREIVSLLPKAYTKRSKVQPVAGTLQTLTGLTLTDGLQFMDIPRNFDSSGAVAGRAITLCERPWLDESRPSWHSETSTEAKHWVAIEGDPKSAFIFPGLSGSGKIEVHYSALPADLANIAAAITLDDIYANALIWWLLFWFYADDSTVAGANQKAQAYMALFFQSLGVRGNALATTERAAAAKAAGG